MKTAEVPTSSACVPGVADRVTTKINARTNPAPTNNNNHSIVGTDVSAATSLVSLAVEILPTWATMLVAVAEFSAPVVGWSPWPSDATRSLNVWSTSDAPTPSVRIDGQSNSDTLRA